MKTNRLLLLVIILAISLTSCVSKKKYLDMESSKLRAEQRVRELTDENEAKAGRIEQMIADFEQMKLGLMENNAQKDQLIANLTGQINTLNSNVKEKDAGLAEKLYAFEFEKRRLEEELKNTKNTQARLREQNESLSEELGSTKNKLADLQFDYTRQKGDVDRINAQVASADKKFEEQASQVAALKTEIQKLKSEGQEKDETIERLKNNVTLLKNELGKK
ncbi:hypothetical protein [Gaoshiqia sp. Z1-71]|uniref:hypothetical protein n=1 Tax=Gaoshiqia hydrogeniformans TaxID=3290090 RepID=UPI003BF833B0